jgi:hypothetical protein
MSAPSTPSWMRPAGIGALGVAGVAAVAHLMFGVGSGGTLSGAMTATVLDPLVFIGLPAGWYFLSQVGRVRIAERRERARRRVEGDAVVRPMLQHEFTTPPKVAPQFPSEPAESSLAGVFLGGIVCAFVIGVTVGMAITTQWGNRSGEETRLRAAIEELNAQVATLAEREDLARPAEPELPAASAEVPPPVLEVAEAETDDEPAVAVVTQRPSLSSLESSVAWESMWEATKGEVSQVVHQDGVVYVEAKFLRSVTGVRATRAWIFRRNSNGRRPPNYVGQVNVLSARGDSIAGSVEQGLPIEGDLIALPLK